MLNVFKKRKRIRRPRNEAEHIAMWKKISYYAHKPELIPPFQKEDWILRTLKLFIRVQGVSSRRKKRRSLKKRMKRTPLH